MNADNSAKLNVDNSVHFIVMCYNAFHKFVSHSTFLVKKTKRELFH